MKYPILSALINEILDIATNSALDDFGKAIEAKAEEASREPDDTKRSELHQEALTLEKELAAKTPEPESKAETAEEKPKTLNWRLVMVPFKVNFKAPANPIEEGDKLGDLTPDRIAFLLHKRIQNPEKYPLESPAERMFRAGMALACEELKIK